MSEIKHTPGPWAYIDATKEARMQYAPKCVIRAGSVQVASFSWGADSKWWPSKEESQANARLIAAAPTMYEYIESSAMNGCAEAKKILEAINGNT